MTSLRSHDQPQVTRLVAGHMTALYEEGHSHTILWNSGLSWTKQECSVPQKNSPSLQTERQHHSTPYLHRQLTLLKTTHFHSVSTAMAKR